jgi:hypothetical protein
MDLIRNLWIALFQFPQPEPEIWRKVGAYTDKGYALESKLNQGIIQEFPWL